MVERPFGKNLGGYRGEVIHIESVLAEIVRLAPRGGWAVRHLEAGSELRLPVLVRQPQGAARARRIHLSAGIHGDEPAGPLAIRELVARDTLPEDLELTVAPCLNPTGFPRNQRECDRGTDLNRQYHDPANAEPEVRAYTRWLESQPQFDLALCLHEDWEAAGFYLYELIREDRQSLARSVVNAVAKVFPIDDADEIDGMTARDGVMNPGRDPLKMKEWPEAVYLFAHKSSLCYTFETSSDYPLASRVKALATAVQAACHGLE